MIKSKMFACRLSRSEMDDLMRVLYGQLDLEELFLVFSGRSSLTRSDLFRMLLKDLPKRDLSINEMKGLAMDYARARLTRFI